MTVEVNNSQTSPTQVFNATFEEKHQLTAIFFKDRWCWIARQVGEVLGYSNGGRQFSKTILYEWREEFVVGGDVEILKGVDLIKFRDVSAKLAPTSTGANQELVSPKTSSLMVLYESGILMALLKTSMPLGIKLRRWLVTEVLPQIARTGKYDGNGRSVGNSPQPSKAEPTNPPKDRLPDPAPLTHYSDEQLKSVEPLFNKPHLEDRNEAIDGVIQMYNIHARYRKLSNRTPTVEEQLRAVQILGWPIVAALAEEEWMRQQWMPSRKQNK